MDQNGQDRRGARQPLNSLLRPALRKLELLFFCGLVFAACAAMAFRGLQMLCDGFALFPVTGLMIPWPAGVAVAVFLFALSAAIAAANTAMLVRFIRA